MLRQTNFSLHLISPQLQRRHLPSTIPYFVHTVVFSQTTSPPHPRRARSIPSWIRRETTSHVPRRDVHRASIARDSFSVEVETALSVCNVLVQSLSLSVSQTLCHHAVVVVRCVGLGAGPNPQDDRRQRKKLHEERRRDAYGWARLGGD